MDREVTALLEGGLSEGSALLVKSRDQQLHGEGIVSAAVKRTAAPLSAEANWLLRASLNMVYMWWRGGVLVVNNSLVNKTAGQERSELCQSCSRSLPIHAAKRG